MVSQGGLEQELAVMACHRARVKTVDLVLARPASESQRKQVYLIALMWVTLSHWSIIIINLII